ncbi:MAG: hypothetical protein ACI4WM_08875 [Erysipelotrichaceae bacterium]
MAQMQEQLARSHIERISIYQLPKDAKQVIRKFFLFSAEQGEAYDKITCSDTFKYIRSQMIRDVQEKANIVPFTSTLPGVFMGTALPEIYKYWVVAGRKQPIEEVIETATSLICNGLEGTL